MDYSKIKIKKSLRDPIKELKDWEQQEFREAEKADIVSNIEQADVLKVVDTFEDVISF